MKKLKISDVLGICAICLVLCLGISIIACKAFHINVDFLSATATLSAAVVAVSLYSDWREQQRFILIEKYQELIRESGKALFLNYSKFHINLKTVRNQFAFPSTDVERKNFYLLDKMEVSNLVQELLSELYSSSTLLHEYLICLNKLNVKNIESDHYKEINGYKNLLLDAYTSLANVEQTPDINYIFRLADLVDMNGLSTAVQKYKELCAYSCVNFLNDQLLNK